MGFELFIARRLKLGSNGSKGSPSLNVALIGVALAIAVMILSIVIVMGFKSEISSKIYALDPHIKVTNAAVGIDNNIATVDSRDVFAPIMADSAFKSQISSMSLTADKPAILKTDSDFKGIVYRGVDDGFDWSYIKSHLTGGRLPRIASDALNEVVISKTIANQLGLKVGDKILTYFIDSKVKVRNSHIVGIFNTDFDHFDKQVMMGNIALIQQVNGWNSYVGNYVGIDMANTGTVREESYSLFKTLALWTYEKGGDTLYNVTNTQDNNKSFFTWLGMLNMNVAIILILMMVVSGFTLVSALLMIVLERIRLVGLLKAMGATNGSVRRIFIYLTQKLIIKALIAGNAVGLGLALLQQNFHIVRLNPEAYYMPYVPIEINATSLVALNVAIVVISYITLLGPSYIVSSIKPTSTMKFE